MLAEGISPVQTTYDYINNSEITLTFPLTYINNSEITLTFPLTYINNSEITLTYPLTLTMTPLQLLPFIQ